MQDSRLKAQFNNVVLRVANQCRKEAALDLSRFDTTGLSSEHRAVVNDIVVQSLRNAIVHGLEPPETRQEIGKPRAGRLRVSLREEAGRVHLTVRDDGCGIDLQKIKRSAVSNGLATSQEMSQWKPAKLIALLFRPGFSTARGNSRHAGRGVGMDLIKSRLDAIGGKVGVSYRTGQYTEFSFTFDKEHRLARTA